MLCSWTHQKGPKSPKNVYFGLNAAIKQPTPLVEVETMMADWRNASTMPNQMPFSPLSGNPYNIESLEFDQKTGVVEFCLFGVLFWKLHKYFFF
jgi:hypothetical protein